MKLTKEILRNIIEETLLDEEEIGQEERACRKKYNLASWTDFLKRMNAMNAAEKGNLGKKNKK